MTGEVHINFGELGTIVGHLVAKGLSLTKGAMSQHRGPGTIT